MSKLSHIYELELSVAHLNHGMREEAGRDEDFVRQICKKLNVPFFVENYSYLEIPASEIPYILINSL